MEAFPFQRNLAGLWCITISWWASFTMSTLWFGLVVLFLFAFLFADPVQGAGVEQPSDLHVPHHHSHTLRG
jgi:hypothetical protein